MLERKGLGSGINRLLSFSEKIGQGRCLPPDNVRCIIMKLQKHVKAFLATAVIAVMLSGCFPTGEVSVPESTPNNIEDLTISISYPEQTPESASEITLRMREWDNDRLIKTFLEGSTITYENIFETVREVTCYAYRTDDNKYLRIEDGMLTYEAQNGSDKNSLYDYYTASYMPDLFPDEALDGFSREEALERVYAVIDKADIKNLGEPEIYAVTAERANKLATIDTKWTKNDELYLMRFPIIYNDIPIINCNSAIPGTSTFYDGSFVTVAISESELVFFQCVNILGEVQKTGDEIQIKYGAENILDQLKLFFSEREHTPLTIIGCTLTYMPSAINGFLELSFKPAWCVRYIEERMPRATKYIIYDANTGVRIVNYGR